MAVGLPAKTTYADGDVFSASDINDTNGTLNLVGQTTNFYAGKNKIINGDFGINQRGFTSNTANGTFGFDRYQQLNSGGTSTVTPQTFTLGAAPVSGYEGTNFVRIVTASQSAVGDYALIQQKVESVRTFAGQTVTFSLWAKASTGTPKIGLTLEQQFGSGGSSSVITSAATTTITSSWARYSFTLSVPSISGKTIGAGDFLGVMFFTSAGTTISGTGYPAVGIQNVTIDTWGWQLEAGSTATAFQTATGTIQGELAACQRYYYRNSPTSFATYLGSGQSMSTTVVDNIFILPVTMRANPSALETNLMGVYASGATRSGGTFTFQYANPNTCTIRYTHGSAVFTNGSPSWLLGTSSGPYIGISAEL
jgi:hypothetical protein